MKREIKFKAWLPCINKMTHPGTIEDISKWAPLGCTSIWLEFTGLQDKNGKEIYDGDIISYDMHYTSGRLINLLVKWDGLNCFWRGYYTEDSGHCLNNFAKSHYEAIGNIYENPELLTPKY